MVDQLDASSQINKEKLTLIASFHCPACASGAEHYSDLFDHGTCVNCGSPLEKFEATLTEKGESELKKSVVLLYSESDAKQVADEVSEELIKKGIGVIDVHDIVKGSQTSVLSANLSYVMNTSAATLVIPSKHLEKDAVINTCLSNAITINIERQKPLVPVYTEVIKDAMDVPLSLIDRAGINWDGKSTVHGAIIGRERFADQIHNLTIKNSSK